MSVETVHRDDGSKVYKVRWRQDGRNRARRFERKGDADAFDAKVRRLRAAGELHLLDARPRGAATFGTYADEWWEVHVEEHLAPATRLAYGEQLDLRLVPRWGDVPVSEIRATEVERWVKQLRQRDGVGDPTVLKLLAIMSGILDRAVRDDELARNPISLMKKPSQRRTREQLLIAPFDVERMRRWLLELDDRRRPAETRWRDATVLSLLAYAGPRPESEALPLRWAQVRDRTLLIRDTKHGGAERTTNLITPLADDLAAWKARGGSVRPHPRALVVPRADGRPWTASDWDNWRTRAFRPAAHAIGLRADARPRDLRGSFASLLIFEGLNVVEVARQLGHEPETCLRSYASVFEEFDPSRRRPAADVVVDARAQVARMTPAEVVSPRAVPTEYPAAGPSAADGAGA